MKKILGRREFAYRSAGFSGLSVLLGKEVFGSEIDSRGTAPAYRSKLRLRPLSSDFIKRLPQMMAITNVPGVAVAFIENGKISWRGDYGVMNAATRETVTANTVWQPASLGKPVFSLGVMKLVESAKLDLDKPLADYITGEIIKDEPRVKQITARRALSHSTGLQNWRFQAGHNLQLAFNPGERWGYSGEGIYLVQRAVEEITGKGLEQFMQETVFKPLGMASSSYYWKPDYDKRLVTMHDQAGAVAPDYVAQNAARYAKVAEEWKKPVESWRHNDQEKAQAEVENRFPPFPTFFAVNAAGSLYATIEDYARVVMALLDTSSKAFLPGRLAAEMLKPQSRINDVVSWGLGWGLQTFGGDIRLWHWGEGMNYRTFVIADRSSGTGILVFTNARNGRKIWERIVSEATGEDQPLLWWLP